MTSFQYATSVDGESSLPTVSSDKDVENVLKELFAVVHKRGSSTLYLMISSLYNKKKNIPKRLTRCTALTFLHSMENIDFQY